MTGAERIAAERERQIHKEGWTPEHDDEHNHGELVDAAICYCAASSSVLFGLKPIHAMRLRWPWDKEWWKPSDDPIRNLEKAGALIAAEIDRLQRARAAQ